MARRGKKLSEETREGILAHYAGCGNLTDTAKKYQVSTSTVHKLVKGSSDEFEGLRRQKKREHIERLNLNAKSWSRRTKHLIHRTCKFI
ncbi:Mor family transcriptional regulator [Croceifilum oryzae]|uniref:Mor family transcriptional regulator n=1 Tax=Croceifilum oryzae TaxID=1553429 RepID=A0AAJ1THN2_9BACL|nr:hypothetical protein [Croceifilum oryzae]MDQ0416194.1 Mor family transcriptional regulator [Croceifilum oryzae]